MNYRKATIQDLPSICTLIEDAKTLIFKFSQEGKPLAADGPVHILFGDGSNRENPIKNIKSIRVQ